VNLLLDTHIWLWLRDEKGKSIFRTEEQLEAALDGIREDCARLIDAGKKVIVQ